MSEKFHIPVNYSFMFKGGFLGKVAVIILIVHIFLCSNIKANEKRVLLISSYGPSFPTFFQMIDGIKSELKGQNIELNIEFIDGKRFADSVNIHNFLNLITHKLEKLPRFDAVITSDDIALHFVLEHQNTLFSEIPIVFTGVNNIDFALAQNNNEWVTGVAETVSMQETLALMMDLFPDTERLCAIVDNTITGQGDYKMFNLCKEKFRDVALECLSLTDLSFDEFGDSLKNIPDNMPVLLISAYNDKNNNNLNFSESLKLIKQNLSAPLFHIYYHGLGDGILGGKMVSHFELGKGAANITQKILNGEKVSGIPVQTKSPNKYAFDFNEIKKYKIDQASLPTSSKIINKPESFFYRYRIQILSILAFVVFQSFIIILLLVNIKKKKQVQGSLKNKVDEYLSLNDEYLALNEEYKTINEDLQVKNEELASAEEELRANLEELYAINDQLELSEERFRLALEASNDGLWDWNLISNEVFFSTRWKAMLGYEKNELEDSFEVWKSLLHKDDIDRAISEVEDYIKGKKDKYELEFRMKHKAGHYVFILAKGILMRRKNGSPYRIIGTHQDLTPRYILEKQLKDQISEYLQLNQDYQRINEELRSRNHELIAAEEELRANLEELELKREEIEVSEERFRLAIEATNDGIWDWNLETEEVYLSPKWKEILGYRDEELPNKLDTWRDLVHQEDLPVALENVNGFVSGNSETYDVEFRMKHKAGHFIHIWSRGLMMRNRKGKAYRIIGTHYDLTERYAHERVLKEQVEENLSLYEEYRTISEELKVKNDHLLSAEEKLKSNNEELFKRNEALKESEDRFRSLFENHSLAFVLCEIIKDENGRAKDMLIRNANPEFIKQTQVLNKAVKGKKWSEVFKNPDSGILSSFFNVVENNEKYRSTIYSKHLDKYFDVNAYCPKDNYFSAIFDDITAKVRAEEELETEKDRSQLILKGTNAGTWDHNLVKSTLNLNERWANMLGYTLADFGEIKPEAWASLIESNDLKSIHLKYHELLSGKIDFLDEVIRQKHKDGHWVWLRSRGNIVEWDGEGNAVRVSGTFMDVSASQEANIKLTQQRDEYSRLYKTYEQVINGATIGTFERHVPTDRVIRNQVSADMIGFKLEELGEDNSFWMSRVHPDDLEKTNFGCAIKQDSSIQSFDITYRMLHKKGHYIWVQCKGNVTDRDEYGAPVKVSGITMEITKQKEAEAALINSERRFKTIFDKSKTVMLIVDPESKMVVDANESAQHFYGYSKEEFDQLSIRTINRIDPLTIEQRMKGAINEERNYFKFKHHLKSNEIRNVEVYTSPIIVEDKKLLHLIVIDTTKADEAEYQINQINKRFQGLERIVHYKASSINDLLQYTLQQIIDYTNSDMGAVYHYDEVKSIFYLNDWSDKVALSVKAAQNGKELHKQDCLNLAVKNKETVIINHPESNYTFQKGQQGQYVKSITIPVVADNKVVSVFWLASKNNEYSRFHAEQIMLLLDTTWILVERQKLQDTQSKIL